MRAAKKPPAAIAVARNAAIVYETGTGCGAAMRTISGFERLGWMNGLPGSDWTWTPNFTGSATVMTRGATVVNTITVTASGVTQPAIRSQQDTASGPNSAWSVLIFNCVAGTPYVIRVRQSSLAAAPSSGGVIALQILAYSDPANDDVFLPVAGRGILRIRDSQIIDVFPSNQQSQIRAQLAFVLEGVITQTLIPKARGRGRALAAESMVVTPAIRALIRDAKIHQIYSSMQAGKKHGMQTMNDALYQLYMNREITREECLRVTSDPNEFQRMIGENPQDEMEITPVDKPGRPAMRR